MITLNSDKKNLLKGLAFSVFSFFTSGVNFLLLFVLASYLTVSDFGELNLYTVLVTIVMMAISLNTVSYVQVAYFKMPIKAFYSRILGIVMISTIVLVILLILLLISYLLNLKIDRLLGLSYEVQLFVIVICYFQVFYQIILELYRIEERILFYGVFSSGYVILNFALTLFFIVCEGYDWLGRVYAHFIVALLTFIISLLLLIKRLHGNYSFFPFKEILGFSIPLIPHSMSSWIRQGGDRYMLNYFYSSNMVGYFSFAFSCANIIHIIGISFNATNSVFIYKNLASLNDSCANILKSQTKRLIVLYSVITIFAISLIHVLINTIFVKYSLSAVYIVPLCLASFFQCIYYLFVNYLFFYKRTRPLMYITFSFSLLHAFLVYISLMLNSYMIAYVNLLSNFLITLSVFIYSQKLYPIFSFKK